MVRVASLKDQVHAGYEKTDIAGLTPKEQLREISEQTHELVRVQYSTFTRSVMPALEKAGLHLILAHEELTEKQKEFADRYFEDNVSSDPEQNAEHRRADLQEGQKERERGSGICYSSGSLCAAKSDRDPFR